MDCHHRLCVCICIASCSVHWTRIPLTPPSAGGVSAQDLSFGKFTRTMSKHFCENYCTLFPALKQKGGSTKCSLLGLQSALMPLSSTMFGVGCYILALLTPEARWLLLSTSLDNINMSPSTSWTCMAEKDLKCLPLDC